MTRRTQKIAHSVSLRTLLLAGCLVLLSACASTSGNNSGPGVAVDSVAVRATNNQPRDNSRYLPRIGGSVDAINSLTTDQLEQLRLISIDLVSALVQLPDINPTAVTLQVTQPRTAFGNLMIRALEDAGYGLQRVSADQGLHYVQYSDRFAQTDAGPINDYVLRVGNVSLGREYSTNNNGVFPSSLMRIDGAERPDLIVLNDEIFKEQGGSGDIFISGVASGRELSGVREISAEEYDRTPLDQRTDRSTRLLSARRSAIARVVSRSELQNMTRLRRTVLIFNDPETRLMGAGNKQAVRLLVREYKPGDIYQIAACSDVDGKNDESILRGIRVVEEFLSYDIPVESVVKAPCRRASFRHPADNSPVAVEVVHHRSIATSNPN